MQNPRIAPVDPDIFPAPEDLEQSETVTIDRYVERLLAEQGDDERDVSFPMHRL